MFGLCVCFLLSVPVQVIAWKDSSPKWLIMCPEWDVKPYSFTHSFYHPMEDRRLSRPGWLVTYWGGLPACRQSPVQAVTGPGIEQLCWFMCIRSNWISSLHINPVIMMMLMMMTMTMMMMTCDWLQGRSAVTPAAYTHFTHMLKQLADGRLVFLTEVDHGISLLTNSITTDLIIVQVMCIMFVSCLWFAMIFNVFFYVVFSFIVTVCVCNTALKDYVTYFREFGESFFADLCVTRNQNQSQTRAWAKQTAGQT